MSLTSEALERRWRGACKAVFREEAGSLADCAAWLAEFTEPISHQKSSFSGKGVICAPTDYCKGAKWLSFDEVDFGRKFAPLSINEIKDIDSLIGAISERMHYSGNIVFGNSGHIENSSNINDSFYIYECGRFGNSKYLAYSTMGRQDEDCFGCNIIGESSYCIKCYRAYRNRRSFELLRCQNCSDCYYSHGLEACKNCIFCFNAESRKNSVGNLELEPGKYGRVKSKLLSEMADLLRRKKRLPSLLEIIGKSRKWKLPEAVSRASVAHEKADKGKVESAFLQTTSVLFGSPLEGGIDSYSAWLSRHTRPLEKCSSAASGRELFMPVLAYTGHLPKDRVLGIEEARLAGEMTRLEEAEAEGLNLENAHERIGKLAFFNVDLREGKNQNVIDCSICFDSSNCYRACLPVYTKYCAYSFWPRSCQYLFGCDSPFDSAFSINCYSCTQLTRCFEIDCCGYCSDSYFCHNCENLHDSMFCFNAKNRKFSIGNSELQPDKYKAVKGMLLSQMADELQKKKDLKWDIYNVACRE